MRRSPPPSVEPFSPQARTHYDLKNVSDKLAGVRALLDQKAASGDITRVQRDSEAEYLAQIERVAQAQAAAPCPPSFLLKFECKDSSDQV